MQQQSRCALTGNLDEHREAGVALDEGGDVRVVRSGKKVSFPMARHGAILNLGGPLANGDHIEDMSLSTLRIVALGTTHPPRSTQVCRQLLLQPPRAGLDRPLPTHRSCRGSNDYPWSRRLSDPRLDGLAQRSEVDGFGE